jgi:phage FluMu gp28-like protein
LCAEEAAVDDNVVYNSMQIGLWNTRDDVMVSLDNKARQLGWSWCAAADGVAHAVLNPNALCIYVSYREDEAKEKIIYAKRIVAALRPDVRPSLVDDNKEYISLSNGSRLLSHPCVEPRGPGKPRLYLDEMAKYPRGMDADIYRAALGALGRGGVIRIGSTPRPAGKFRELVEAEDADNGPERLIREWPWWIAPHLAKDLRAAVLNASNMTTEQRVDRFGTDYLKKIFAEYQAAGDIGGFQQEYECAFVSETAALIPEHYIKDAQQEYELGGMPNGSCVIGADFAAQQDRTEYHVVSFNSSGYRLVALDRMRGADQAQQTDRLAALIKQYQPFKVYCDITDGFGRAIVLDLERTFPFIEGIVFNPGSKALMAAAISGAFSNHKITIPRDPLLADDIASAKKIQTITGQTKYETRRTAKGHGDGFWALALALYACPRAGGDTFEYKPIETRPNWTEKKTAAQEWNTMGRTKAPTSFGDW